MKKIILSLAILATLSMGASAQTEQGKGRKDGANRPSPMKELNLTDQQEQQMKALHESYQVSRKQLSDSHKQEMMKILTPEQQAKWQEMEKNKPQRKAPKGEGKRGDKDKKCAKGKKGGCKPDTKLDDVTKAKVDALTKEYEEKKSAIEKTRIAPDVQKEQLEALKKQYKADRRALIDPASFSK